MNEATRYLSPTKTLEYLAAHKPVVSTPIPDIIEAYGDYVRIWPHASRIRHPGRSGIAGRRHGTPRTLRRERDLLARYTLESIANRWRALYCDEPQDKSVTIAKATTAHAGGNSGSTLVVAT